MLICEKKSDCNECNSCAHGIPHNFCIASKCVSFANTFSEKERNCLTCRLKDECQTYISNKDQPNFNPINLALYGEFCPHYRSLIFNTKCVEVKQ